MSHLLNWTEMEANISKCIIVCQSVSPVQRYWEQQPDRRTYGPSRNYFKYFKIYKPKIYRMLDHSFDMIIFSVKRNRKILVG